MKSDKDTTIQELKVIAEKYITDRHWQRHHTPKNLAMNLAVEAAELMEHFVWDREGEPGKQAIADELADVFFNVLSFANRENIDLTSASQTKLEELRQRYPTEIFNEKNDSLADYHRIKQSQRSSKSKERP